MTDSPPRPGAPRPDAATVVADAIQSLTAARLGRGFLPLALLFAAGGVEVVRSSVDGWWTALGAVATAGVMLAYGLRTVQRVLGRDHRPWMSVVVGFSVLPPVYALYVLGWRGVRVVATGGGTSEIVAAILFTLLGVWVLRAWLRVVEIERLAQVMTLDWKEDTG